MGKFVRTCTHGLLGGRRMNRMASASRHVAHVFAKVSKLPLIISSMSWEVISEGLKSTQAMMRDDAGKCIVNGISMASSEQEFVRVAAECRRFGAAIVVLAMSRVALTRFLNRQRWRVPELSDQEKVTSCQRAYQLLRSKLDFLPEDFIFDCLVTPLGSHGNRASPKDFIDAVAEVRRTCPGVSFIAGVSNLGVACRSAAMLREALASTPRPRCAGTLRLQTALSSSAASCRFLPQAVSVGLNLALVELGRLPRVDSLEDSDQLCYLQPVQEGKVRLAQEAQKAKAKVVNTLQPKEKSALVPVKQRAPQPARPSPQFTHPVEILVQATRTVSASVFQTFGSKAHAAANFHRLGGQKHNVITEIRCLVCEEGGRGGAFDLRGSARPRPSTKPCFSPRSPCTWAREDQDRLDKAQVWSRSLKMLEDGGSAEAVKDPELWERPHQGINQYSTTVPWGAIGEIGLRKAIYGSRDVFARPGTEAHRTGRHLLPREAGLLQSLDLGLRWPGLPGQHLAASWMDN
ncbi:Mtr [Symbiodinium sp. CCMP2592]|nr:Mtr [Symbiodinium sp. CCMP2592]